MAAGWQLIESLHLALAVLLQEPDIEQAAQLQSETRVGWANARCQLLTRPAVRDVAWERQECPRPCHCNAAPIRNHTAVAALDIVPAGRPGSSTCTAAKALSSVCTRQLAIAAWRPLQDELPTIVHTTPQAGD